MKLLRWALLIAAVLLLAVAIILWFNRPELVDMADYAPADSLVYLELNSLPELAKTTEQSEMWKELAPIAGVNIRPINAWGVRLARSGLSPVRSVVFARAQFALVVVGMNSIPEGDTLRIRPEVAVIIETHTPSWRIKGEAVSAIKQLADYAYGQSNCGERSLFNAHFVECSAAVGDRKLVGAIDGTVVIIGNGPAAVQHCLEVRRGMRPSLRTDANMQRLRESMQSRSALSFGYISSSNAAKIFSWAAPLLMGKAPGDPQLEQLLSTSASKIVGAIAWTSRGSSAGIEDHYLFSLEPEVIERLKPTFAPAAPVTGDFWRLIPPEVQSLTIYHQNSPLNAWTALNSAVAFKLDAVSAVVFAAVLRSALGSYAITNPPEMLSVLSSPLATMRSPDNESSILIARAPDPALVRQTLNKQAGQQIQILDDRLTDADPKREFTAVFHQGFVVIGKTSAVQSWLDLMREVKYRRSLSGDFDKLQSNGNVAITTFSDDVNRVNSFIVTAAAIKGAPLSSQQKEKLKTEIENGIFSTTETTLSSNGIERKTISAFGQLSTLVSLAQADSASTSGP